MTGTLNFLNQAIVPGRVFTRRMYNKMESKIHKADGQELKPYHHVNIDREFKNDCQVWLNFLKHQSDVNCSFMDLDEETDANDISFFTDSSENENLGFGCYMGALNQWTFGQWEPGFIKKKNPSIAYLELYALCVGNFCWKDHLNNGRILLHCDYEAVVNMVNKMTLSCKNCMYLLRMLMLNNLIHNRTLRVEFVSSKGNFWADALSRLDFNRFWKKRQVKRKKKHQLLYPKNCGLCLEFGKTDYVQYYYCWI